MGMVWGNAAAIAQPFALYIPRARYACAEQMQGTRAWI